MKFIIASYVATLFVLCSGAMAGIGTGFNINAEQIMENHDDQTMALRGHAQVTQGSHKLVAEKIIINKKSGTILALDGVTYDNGKAQTNADRMLFKVSGQRWQKRD